MDIRIKLNNQFKSFDNRKQILEKYSKNNIVRSMSIPKSYISIQALMEKIKPSDSKNPVLTKSPLVYYGEDSSKRMYWKPYRKINLRGNCSIKHSSSPLDPIRERINRSVHGRHQIICKQDKKRLAKKPVPIIEA